MDKEDFDKEIARAIMRLLTAKVDAKEYGYSEVFGLALEQAALRALTAWNLEGEA